MPSKAKQQQFARVGRGRRDRLQFASADLREISFQAGGRLWLYCTPGNSQTCSLRDLLSKKRQGSLLLEFLPVVSLSASS